LGGSLLAIWRAAAAGGVFAVYWAAAPSCGHAIIDRTIFPKVSIARSDVSLQGLP